ncbi:hypothetical protein [Acinetobacter bereziniae]|uniref:hypothetical protein n=1 Tax=Acinetobacter bereziniae TaxID=106648 RepID=UPI00125061F5|nr:hypothetical protein [Acinetobacter bereziniae]
MKYVFLVLVLCFGLMGCVSNSYEQYVNTTNQSNTCKEANQKITKRDYAYNKSIDLTLYKFGGLKRSDLDAEYCLDANSVVDNTILVSKYYQLNRRFVGNRIQAYTAYNAFTNKSVAVIFDDNFNTYIVGDKNKELLDAISSQLAKEKIIGYADINSAKTFNDLQPSTLNQKYAQYSESLINIPSKYSIYSGSGSSKTVNVREYTRSDGTYVRPHTRSAPRSRR